jgi:hypothetical protein
MRQADRDELAAAVPTPVLQVVTGCVKFSTYSRAGLVGDDLVCLFGVGPVSLIDDKGIPWMLSTPLIEEHPYLFLQHCKKQFGVMKEQYSTLENHVSVSNTVAIGWLKWLGFTFEDAAPWGYRGLPFHKFYVRR